MKTTYEERGIKFGKFLAKMFENCENYGDFARAMDRYNKTHKNKLHWAHGYTRIAIIRSDYVIKFTYRKNTFAGDCISEQRVYEMAKKAGMEHLFAKTTLIEEYGHVFAIMPRINGVDDSKRFWWEHCTDEEHDWINKHVTDLGERNLGYRRGKVCIIDYAYTRKAI